MKKRLRKRHYLPKKICNGLIHLWGILYRIILPLHDIKANRIKMLMYKNRKRHNELLHLQWLLMWMIFLLGDPKPRRRRLLYKRIALDRTILVKASCRHSSLKWNSTNPMRNEDIFNNGSKLEGKEESGGK